MYLKPQATSVHFFGNLIILTNHIRVQHNAELNTTFDDKNVKKTEHFLRNFTFNLVLYFHNR